MTSAEAESRLKEGLSIRAFILGALFAAVVAKDFPLKVRDIEEWADDEGNIQAFSVITDSGLRCRVNVVFEGEEP